MFYQASDKNNSNLDRAMVGRFRHFLDDVDLKKTPLVGRKFTWSNERRSPTLVRLDRDFCCQDWENIFPNSVLQSNASTVSEHCPLILGLKIQSKGKRRFHFESFWTRVPGFLEVVQVIWSAPVQSTCAVEGLFLKLQRLSKDLQRWGQRNVGNIKLQLEMAKEILHRLEVARDSRELSDSEWLRKKLKLHCLGLSSLERTIARLRSRSYIFVKAMLTPRSSTSRPVSGKRRILLPSCKRKALRQSHKRKNMKQFQISMKICLEQQLIGISRLIFLRLGCSNMIFQFWKSHFQRRNFGILSGAYLRIKHRVPTVSLVAFIKFAGALSNMIYWKLLLTFFEVM